MNTQRSFENIETSKQGLYISESTDFLIETIEQNARENFIYQTSRDNKHPDEQERHFQEYTIRGEYDAFMMKIQIYIDRIHPESEIIKDILFLQGIIQSLFETYYSKNTPLVSIFHSTEEKQRFSLLVRKYLIEGFSDAIAEAEKMHPKPFLTQEEKEALLH